MAGPDGLLARKGAILVKWGFEKYRSGFRRITRRSRDVMRSRERIERER